MPAAVPTWKQRPFIISRPATPAAHSSLNAGVTWTAPSASGALPGPTRGTPRSRNSSKRLGALPDPIARLIDIWHGAQIRMQPSASGSPLLFNVSSPPHFSLPFSLSLYYTRCINHPCRRWLWCLWKSSTTRVQCADKDSLEIADYCEMQTSVTSSSIRLPRNVNNFFYYSLCSPHAGAPTITCLYACQLCTTYKHTSTLGSSFPPPSMAGLRWVWLMSLQSVEAELFTGWQSGQNLWTDEGRLWTTRGCFLEAIENWNGSINSTACLPGIPTPTPMSLKLLFCGKYRNHFMIYAHTGNKERNRGRKNQTDRLSDV